MPAGTSTAPVLKPIIDRIEADRAFGRLLRWLTGPDRFGLLEVELTSPARPAVVGRLLGRVPGPVVLLTASPEAAKQLAEQVRLWADPGLEVAVFPEPEALPYQRVAAEPFGRQARLGLLHRLAGLGNPPALLVVSAPALLARFPAPEQVRQAALRLEVGTRLSPEALARRLVALGYEPATVVTAPGTFARRGGIVDFYPPTEPWPVRVEFFGDEVDSLRHFNPADQRSVALIRAATAGLARELVVDAEGLGRLRQVSAGGLRDEARLRLADELRRLEAGEWFDGAEFYGPFFNRSSLFDYLPTGAVVIIAEPAELRAFCEELHRQAEDLRSAQVGRGELSPDFPRPYLLPEEVARRWSAVKPRVELVEWASRPDSLNFGWVEATGFGGQVERALAAAAELARRGNTVVIASLQAERLAELLPEAPGGVQLVNAPVSGGWVMAEPEGRGAVYFLTDAELFGFVRARRGERRRLARVEQLLADLVVGDYLVHEEFGIGRFRGLVRGTDRGAERDYLLIEYADGDRVYVPADQVDRITRYYGTGDRPPTLTRLGSAEWTRAKARARQAALNIARELLETQAVRQIVTRPPYSPDTQWQLELEASFPYTETPDQLEAVRAVKADLEGERPMDRLICGDVGYGKTEVALRAAFKVVQDGRQVAVLVPTTVLAEQHYQTFRSRLAAFPVRVEVLSRLRPEREQAEVVRGLREGTVDIVIGTHRLLQPDVVFKDLGLLVIDEEHRFGVLHKERFKMLRREVDVLTLSATPIPRTLYLALTGLRDLSMMETPPEERLPVKTFVGEYDDLLVRQAILRELDRGGQVFYVHNRVYDIQLVARRLKKLVPEARFVIGHGQMADESLERVMADFGAGRYDVLVCTTIIEAGIDLPNVNTLIVDDADRFGLAQLYQLRGRVGRGSNQAYAYFLTEPGKRLTEAARRRLRTILEAAELGAGYQIALRDLEIRGAGNLLGVEQSGHIAAVGFELYCKLLAEAVAELKGERPRPTAPPEPAPAVDLALPAYLPPDYVGDVSLRLQVYRRLAGVRDLDELDDLASELRDRFGPYPTPVQNLLSLVRLKLLGARAGIESITTFDGRVIINFRRPAGAGGWRELARRLRLPLEGGPTQLRVERQQLGRNWLQGLERLVSELAAA